MSKAAPGSRSAALLTTLSPSNDAPCALQYCAASPQAESRVLPSVRGRGVEWSGQPCRLHGLVLRRSDPSGPAGPVVDPSNDQPAATSLAELPSQPLHPDSRPRSHSQHSNLNAAAPVLPRDRAAPSVRRRPHVSFVWHLRSAAPVLRCRSCLRDGIASEPAMASSSSDTPAAGPSSSPAPQQSGSRPSSVHEARTSSPVEMKTLPPSATEAAPTPAPTTQISQPVAEPSAAAEATREESVPSQSQEPQRPETTQPAPSPAEPTGNPATNASPPTQLSRTETEAIGPSTDSPAPKPDQSNGPVVSITLLLTNGARHPYKIDERYLKKRSVNVDAMDPYNISVYTLKELIWRDWREGAFPLLDSDSAVHSDGLRSLVTICHCASPY